MSKGLRNRLIAFAALAAIGIVYVASSYLGVFDTLLGRKVSMYVDLPRSGGLFVGSEVDDRGVKIGKVTGMAVTHQGVRVTISVDKDAHLPATSGLQVTNLTAVGEQYLDFQPADKAGPYAGKGHVFAGTEGNLPESTDRLLMDISDFVNSVNPRDLQVTVGELGTMFKGNANALGQMIDSGSTFVNTAAQNEPATLALIDQSQTVLQTQAAHAADIQAFAKGLAQLTDTLRTSDANLRTILTQTSPALKEVDSLVNGLRTVLPNFFGALIPVNQVVTDRLRALEETLVVFPPVIASGFTGTAGDGYGHLNMQFDYSLPACSGNDYLPKPWPNANDTSDLPLYNARCNDPKGQPAYHGSGALLQRGVNMTPPVWAPVK